MDYRWTVAIVLRDEIWPLNPIGVSALSTDTWLDRRIRNVAGVSDPGEGTNRVGGGERQGIWHTFTSSKHRITHRTHSQRNDTTMAHVHPSVRTQPSLLKQFGNFTNSSAGLEKTLRLIHALCVIAAEVCVDSVTIKRCLIAQSQLALGEHYPLAITKYQF